MTAWIYIHTNSIQGFPFFYILINFCNLWSFQHSYSDRCGQYLIVVLICISLMVSSAEDLSISLLLTFVSFGKGLLRSLAYFFFFFQYWIVGAIYIFWNINLVSVISTANNFSHSTVLFFFFLTLLMVSFAVQNILSLIRSNIFIFALFPLSLETYLQKY